MSDKEKEKEINVPPQEIKPELENEEEEPVDEELQKQIKEVKIDNSVFSGSQKKDKKKKHDKKNSKKKGIDFMEYANKNNIQVNLEYEEDKYENNNYHNDDRKYNNNKKYDNRNKNYNNKRGGYKNNSNNNNNYNNNQNRGFKFGGNKFDFINQKNFENHFYQFPTFKDDNEIKDYIENLFSEQTLNKDLYLRYRINDKGQILINDLANYTSLNKNNIDSNKIIDLMKDSNKLEKCEIEGKNYLTIKNFSELKLLTIDEINENKKQMKNQRKQQQYIYQNQMASMYGMGINDNKMPNFIFHLDPYHSMPPQQMYLAQPFNNNNNQ